jgi:4-oxalocrotonate tautomerase
MPQTDLSTREKLAARLTEAVFDIAEFEKEIFGVRFDEYQAGGAAHGGKLWRGKDSSPNLHLVLYCPRLRRSVKRKLVESFTAIFVETLGQPEWLPVIHICEHPYDNVGVDGKLLSDMDERLAARKFYYELPED